MMLQIAQRIGIPFVLLLLAVAYFCEVRTGKEQDLMLIKPVFYLMVVLFIINAATDMRAILRERSEGGEQEKENASLKKILSFAGLAILLVAALPFAGFLLSSTLFMFLVLFMFKVEKKAVLFLMPVGVSVTLYLLFAHVFAVELPVGVLGF
ncbi:tripartite tricarboxylate transporter TctB family protein [Desulfovibrio sp. OttesenSCG-928-O18]|nr:tripartite tricarboxylate transporter TctB family protein [Desulfovibrio sp. OttesenSCG-928-O18]